MGAKLVTSPLDCLAPLLGKVASIGGMGQLDADCIAIAVANVPAQAVLRHSVVYRGTVKLHHMMDGVRIISAPIIDVIAGASAGVRRLMDYKIARI